MTADENSFPPFVESLLGLDNDDTAVTPNEAQTPIDPIADIANVNSCVTKDSLRQLNRKLVRFDCQICDMYEEEYFAPVVPKREQRADAENKPLIYKYFSHMSNNQLGDYDSDAVPCN